MMLPQWLELTCCICIGLVLGALALIIWVKLGIVVLTKIRTVIEGLLLRLRAPISEVDTPRD